MAALLPSPKSHNRELAPVDVEVNKAEFPEIEAVKPASNCPQTWVFWVIAVSAATTVVLDQCDSVVSSCCVVVVNRVTSALVAIPKIPLVAVT